MLQSLAVSADKYNGNESDASMVKNVYTPQRSEDDDDGTDDAQRAPLNVNSVDGDWTTSVAIHRPPL
ncbi:hypothetical protein KIN20_014003 [Parelaphostrongylus tenuis]|uniref:Uncharacterized protein n=1 Tax=Parelaphostrongylus tenuis TaxID=148309 RepID=A0AAD5N2P8_PARTN|nr:hypothetical protein KIN20_014003 [Parelaphostrongylus tenuis]